jgi:hypothetical protein
MDLSISEAGSPGAGPLSDIIRRAFADVAARFGITA